MRSERGSATIELTLLTPVLLTMLLLVVAGGRITNVRSDIDAAARDGARAASIARTANQARHDAEVAIRSSLETHDLSCSSPAFDIDTTKFHPGGTVQVRVDCAVSLSDLTLLPLPTSREMHAQFSEVIDTHRESPT